MLVQDENTDDIPTESDGDKIADLLDPRSDWFLDLNPARPLLSGPLAVPKTLRGTFSRPRSSVFSSYPRPRSATYMSSAALRVSGRLE
jgi:hypothetical protein